MNKKALLLILLALTSTNTFCAVPPTTKLTFATKYALYVAGLLFFKSHVELHEKNHHLEKRLNEIQRTQQTQLVLLAKIQPQQTDPILDPRVDTRFGINASVRSENGNS